MQPPNFEIAEGCRDCPRIREKLSLIAKVKPWQDIVREKTGQEVTGSGRTCLSSRPEYAFLADGRQVNSSLLISAINSEREAQHEIIDNAVSFAKNCPGMNADGTRTCGRIALMGD